MNNKDLLLPATTKYQNCVFNENIWNPADRIFLYSKIHQACFCFPLLSLIFNNHYQKVGWLVGWLILNAPVNIFSVMLGRSHRFLGITSTFGGVTVPCSRTQHGSTRVGGLEPPTSGSGVRLPKGDGRKCFLSKTNVYWFCGSFSKVSGAVKRRFGLRLVDYFLIFSWVKNWMRHNHLTKCDSFFQSLAPTEMRLSCENEC